MANWWDAAPIVEAPQANWWDAAPIVEQTAEKSAPAQRPVDDRPMAEVMGGDWMAGAQRGNEAMPATGRNSPLGMVDTAVRGAADMATFGFADEIAAGANAALQPILGTGAAGNTLAERYRANVQQERATDTADAAERGGTRLAGQIGGGVGSALGLAGAGLLPSINAMGRGAGLGRVAALSGAEGAVMGGLQGAGSATSMEAVPDAARDGALFGMAIGGAAPVVAQGISSAARRAVSPMTITPERVAAADVLRREGVDATAGQISGRTGLRYRESELGGARVADLLERQGEQFTGAALRRAGIDAQRATPDVIEGAFTRIGQQIDDAVRPHAVVADRQLAEDLFKTVREYGRSTAESMRAPIVADLAGDIVNALSGGNRMPGDVYARLTSDIARRARAAGNNPPLREALYGLRETLDDAMERSIRQAGGEGLGALRQARTQYRNLLTLEKAATGAGENAALGLISPSALRNATVNTQGRRNYARGSGDFAELARAGEALLKPLPNSGTAGRIRAQNMGAALPTLLGAGAGGAYGAYSGDNFVNTLMGMAAGAAAPRMMGSVMMSGPGQRYLTNQAMAGQMSPFIRSLINAPAVGVGSGIYPRVSGP